MFDLSIITGMEKKNPADILSPLKDKITEALGHEPEQFTVELNIDEGTMRIAAEGRSETMKNKTLIRLAMKLVKGKLKTPLKSEPVMGSIYWDRGKVSMAVKTDKNEILTQDFL